VTSAGDPLVVALDQPDVALARACVERLDGTARRFKVGSALFTRSGPAFVNELVDRGLDVFLDLKFHDTPATVAAAVTAAGQLGAWLLTVHAAGGPAMLAAAREAAARAGQAPGATHGPLVVAVTMLTSLDQAAYARVAGPGAPPLGAAAEALAAMAIEAGLDGVVTSAREARALRAALGPAPLLVVPGIRPSWTESDHAGQARTATPAEALAAGASLLVLGRAVTEAPDPRAAFDRVRAEVAAA
jgi:orotidine-5'-phosphate decarboxylase